MGDRAQRSPTMDTLEQQLDHERAEADLRKDYEESLANVEKLHKKTSADILSGVKERLKGAKWLKDHGAAADDILDEINRHIMEEQDDVRNLHERSVAKLRGAIGSFHEGMAAQNVDRAKMTKEDGKDKLLDSRKAAQEEVEIAKRKQGFELNEKMRIMEEGYLKRIAELEAQMKEAIERRDSDIEGLKLSLSKQGKDLAELKREHELLKAQSEKKEEELDTLRKLTKDQESEITELRLEMERMAMMRDGFDELMQKIEDRVQKILNEARRAIRKMHEAVPQPQNVIDALDTMKEGPVMESLHHAVNSVLRDRDAILENVQKLTDKLAKIELDHALALRSLQKELEKAKAEIDGLKASSGSEVSKLRDRIAELEARVTSLGEDKRALTVALTSGVERVDDEHKSIQGTLKEQEKYLAKYRQRIAQLESGQNERKRLELQMVAENRKTSELRHLSRLCTRLLKDKDEKSSELADAISRAQLAASSFTIGGGDHTGGGGGGGGGGAGDRSAHLSSGGMFGFSPDPSMIKPGTASTGSMVGSMGGALGGPGRSDSMLFDGGYKVPGDAANASVRGLNSRGGMRSRGGARSVDDKLMGEMMQIGDLPRGVTSAYADAKQQRSRQRVMPPI